MRSSEAVFAGTLRGAYAANGLSEGRSASFTQIEKKVAGRLGVTVLDALSGETASHRGDERLRAGLPKDRPMGDKIGTGSRGNTNAIGLTWPPRQAPIIIAAYLTETMRRASSATRRSPTSSASSRARFISPKPIRWTRGGVP